MMQPAIALPRARLTELNCWAADNGCFAKGELFDLSKFYAWLDKVKYAQSNWMNKSYLILIGILSIDSLSEVRLNLNSEPVLLVLFKKQKNMKSGCILDGLTLLLGGIIFCD